MKPFVIFLKVDEAKARKGIDDSNQNLDNESQCSEFSAFWELENNIGKFCFA